MNVWKLRQDVPKSASTLKDPTYVLAEMDTDQEGVERTALVCFQITKLFT